MDITFPQYRKYKNERSYFKIPSMNEWEEIQIIGSKCVINKFEVKILPDRNFIQDMLFEYIENWEAIEEKEYETIREKVQ